MGGDAAPGEIVAGAVAAARDLQVTIRLVGPTAVVADELARVAGASVPANLSILDAADVIGMDEAPLAALRRKPRASIKVAAEAVVRGEADALYSAGHTGATLMAAHAAFGMLPGAERPALAILIPTLTGQSVLLDTGATMDCRPEHLRAFAVMGAAYARIALQVEAPRVGLLSVGEEAAKGNELVREAHGLLATTRGFTFVGNIEARDLFAGHADVVVCDGFTGNIVLKTGDDAEARGGALAGVPDRQLAGGPRI
jgi:glycerol-3-phosphate acyltransferase PlsX